MPTEWYATMNGQRHGPMTVSQLKTLSAMGKLSPNDFVWSDAMAIKVRALEVIELSDSWPTAHLKQLDRQMDMSSPFAIPQQAITANSYTTDDVVTAELIDSDHHVAALSSNPITYEIIVQILAPFESSGSVFISPKIPPQKVNNARSTMRFPIDERIHAIIDCTIWGSAKDALVFGAEGVYFNNGSMSKKPGPSKILYRDFETRSFIGKGGSTVCLGNADFLDLSGCYLKAPTVVAILDGIKKIVAPHTVTNPITEAELEKQGRCGQCRVLGRLVKSTALKREGASLLGALVGTAALGPIGGMIGAQIGGTVVDHYKCPKCGRVWDKK